MGWPQIAVIGLWAAGIGLALARHGEPETGKHSVFTTLIAVGLMAWLLWEGGFWS